MGKEQQGALVLEGALTIYRLPELKRAVVAQVAARERVVIDLERVSEIDTAGIQFLLWVVGYAKQHGVGAELRRCSFAVLELVSFFRLEAALGLGKD